MSAVIDENRAVDLVIGALLAGVVLVSAGEVLAGLSANDSVPAPSASRHARDLGRSTSVTHYVRASQK